MSFDLFILAGEASGDLHASRLVAALREQNPNLHAFGITGPRMRDEGVETLIPNEEFQMMGFVGVIKSLSSIKRQLKTVQEAIMKEKPALVVLVDYAGFNMRLARELRRAGYQGKIVQYICPKFWAWRPKRKEKLIKTLDRLLVIFPFEKTLFEGTSLPVDYVGNPLIEEIATRPPEQGWRASRNISSEAKVIGVFPGSRKSEIKLNLPQMLETVSLLRQDDPSLFFALSIASDHVRPYIMEAVEKWGESIALIEPAESHQLMAESHAALATSGTVNLELALRKVPTVVVYRISHLNAVLARVIFRINLKFYCIVNIIAGSEVFPELMYVKFTPSKAAKAVRAFIQDGESRKRCLDRCDEIEALLDHQSPSREAAQVLTSF